MGDDSKIEWTNATWNPLVGCSRISHGCDHCYAIPTVSRGEAMGTKQHVGLTVKIPAEVAVELRTMYEIEKGTGRPAHRGAWVAEKYPELATVDVGADGRDRRGPVLTQLGRTMARDERRLDWNGKITVVDHLLDWPLRKKKPRLVFVNSLSDLFHDGVDDDTIARIFAVMALAPQHTFQVLTKRPQRMARWMNDDFLGETAQHRVQGAILDLTRSVWKWKRPVIFDPRMASETNHYTPRGDLADDPHYERRVPLTWPLPNVHLGVSIESDKYTWRADYLRETPAAVRWISAEPLLGPLDSLDLTDIDWLVAGGESGSGARPMHPDWVRGLRDECLDRWCPECGSRFPGDFENELSPNCSYCDGEWVGTAFFFKQGGDYLAKQWGCSDSKGGTLDEIPEEFRVREMPRVA